MSATTATQREAIDTATETIQGNCNSPSTARLTVATTIENDDSKSTSGSTQKTSTTSRRSNKSKHRSARLAVAKQSSNKPSSKRARQQKKRHQRLLATQASTTAMFCPVPWCLPESCEEPTTHKSITSTIPAQEYSSYQSHETSECSEVSGIELGEPPLVTPPASPKSAPAGFSQTPPNATKIQALTPSTEALTEVESIASESSRIELARPRALLFEESMRKIEHDAQLSQRPTQDEPSPQTSTANTRILSPLRFVLFAIVLALLAAHANITSIDDFIDDVPDFQAAALEKAASIEQEALQQAAAIQQEARQQAAWIRQQALQQARSMNETAIAQASMITQQAYQTASTLQEATLATKQMALQEAKSIHQQALQEAKSIQQQALQEAKALQEEANKQAAIQQKQEARKTKASIQQQASIQQKRQNPISQWWTKLVNLKTNLSKLREQRKQRRNAYKQQHSKRGKAMPWPFHNRNRS